MALKRIQKELLELNKEKLQGISVGPVSESDLFHWQGAIQGPPKSVFKGGIFQIDITFPSEYPFRPPTIVFKTRIYHPNIDADGSICLQILKSDVWKPATRITHVLLALVDLLEHPNPDDALVASIAEVYRGNPDRYAKTAKEYVKKVRNLLRSSD
ncbi:uncharacterized protein VTP21DRAFT_2680 [Calcarisporiella thermophila]|uniref:uncharacterized protein n=1 Tax=Calcarisporiella thermophila TaxID=911321 RepID=UPI003743EE59